MESIMWKKGAFFFSRNKGIHVAYSSTLTSVWTLLGTKMEGLVLPSMYY